MYLSQTELFEIELIICMKMDLALNNLRRLICHKTQISNQLTFTPGQIGPRGNENEVALHVYQISNTDVSPSDDLVSDSRHTIASKILIYIYIYIECEGCRSYGSQT